MKDEVQTRFQISFKRGEDIYVVRGNEFTQFLEDVSSLKTIIPAPPTTSYVAPQAASHSNLGHCPMHPDSAYVMSKKGKLYHIGGPSNQYCFGRGYVDFDKAKSPASPAPTVKHYDEL